LILRNVVAIILIQTLRFKFSAHPDSIYIFSKVGLESNGRIIIDVLKLIAAILLLVHKTVWVGAILTLGIIGGAIVIRLTKLGLEINNDGGILFISAVVTFILSSVILYKYRRDFPIIIN
jgi:hypothetical protein